MDTLAVLSALSMSRGRRPSTPLPSSLRAPLRRRPNGLSDRGGVRPARTEVQKGTSDMMTTTRTGRPKKVEPPQPGAARQALMVALAGGPEH
jgi:hypothetical protein